MDYKRNPKFEEERKLFLATGLCISLTLVIVAMRWEFRVDEPKKNLQQSKEAPTDELNFLPNYYTVEETTSKVEADGRIVDQNQSETFDIAVTMSEGATGITLAPPPRTSLFNATKGTINLSAEVLAVDKINREIVMIKTEVKMLHDKLIPPGFPEGADIPLQEGIYTHTAQQGTYLKYLERQQRLNELRGDSLEIAVAQQKRMQKQVDKQLLLNRIAKIKIEMKRAELRRKIAEEKALDRFRIYGTPDNSVKVDLSNTTALNFAEVLNGRVPGLQVTYDKGQPIISIRGSAREPLYLLNGMPVEKIQLTSFPVSFIATIDALRSPEKTGIFGARAGGGVINIITKMPPVVTETAQERQTRETFENDQEKRLHLENAGRMEKEVFLNKWIEKNDPDNPHLDAFINKKIYKVRRCYCQKDFCNGWRMEVNKFKYDAFLKSKTTE